MLSTCYRVLAVFLFAVSDPSPCTVEDDNFRDSQASAKERKHSQRFCTNLKAPRPFRRKMASLINIVQHLNGVIQLIVSASPDGKYG